MVKASLVALLWMSLDFTDDQSTLVQVMAWCRQAPSHYLSQCWPSRARSPTPYVVTRPQWIKLLGNSNQWYPRIQSQYVSTHLESATSAQVIRKRLIGNSQVKCNLIFMFVDVVDSILLLTHWGRVTHICISDLTIIGSNNGLSPEQRQGIT